MVRLFKAARTLSATTALAVAGAMVAYANPVFQCRTVGQTVFQDVPCPPAPSAAPATPPDARSQAVQDAIKRKAPIVGMKSTELLATWGHPVHIDRPDGRSGSRQHWKYDRGVVSLENGAVVDIRSN